MWSKPNHDTYNVVQRSSLLFCDLITYTVAVVPTPYDLSVTELESYTERSLYGLRDRLEIVKMHTDNLKYLSSALNRVGGPIITLLSIWHPDVNG